MAILKMGLNIVLEWSGGHLSKDPSSYYLIILHKDTSSTLVDCHFQHHNLYKVGFLY
ncbi:hypothetical protein EGK_18219 [Macaca mulatta]|uniref:Uncharacterized protein n=2 Tax=Macaca TaxID=9539 RepID=F7HM81_MACMU|nr:hypothetical protein EGK_18219 [Macaca mulatta]EHH63654.1 hypothetical protein EGM_16664 [Macaca fascicularis]